MSKQTVGYVKLEWVCPNCNGRNPGPVKTCENCGAPQPENVKFERAAEEKIITDENSIKAAQAGADIHCGFCGTRNPATATTCSQCGGDLKEGKVRQAGQELAAAPVLPKTVICKNCGIENPSAGKICSKCGSPLPRAVAERPASTPAAKSPAAPLAKKKQNWLSFGGIGAALMLCCAAILYLFVFPSSSVQGSVADVHWQTSVPVQEQKEVRHNDESGSAPSDAYDISCRTETNQVCEDKTIDTGNGYAEVQKVCRDESTDYCSYTVMEWQTIQTYTLDGNDLSPIYSDPSITSGQRVGTASEELTVTFSSDKGEITYSPASVSEFQQFDFGSTWKLKLNALGGVVSIER
jgi:ribosomal protein L40E